MTEPQLKKILKQLTNHERRLVALEESTDPSVLEPSRAKKKQRTLREIVRGREFKNGQEQIATIVGYHENILGSLIKKNEIKKEWMGAKMTNKYSVEFISRAKDVLIRVNSDGTCDLTQTGENFFEKFLENEPTKTTS